MTPAPPSLPARTRLRYVAAGLLAVAALTVAGCGGSSVGAQEAAAANAAVQGRGGGGQAGPVGNDTGSVAPGTTTPGTPGTGTPGTGPTTAPGTGGPGSSSDPDGTGGGPGPASGPLVKAGNCAGFKNQVGITDSTITLGNASDLSGPIPGLFVSAQQAAKAYVAYFNATNPQGICGRRLVLEAADTRTDAGADNTAYAKLCDQTFAAIGSLAAFDAGGAGTAQRCGIPDIRALATQGDRNDCTTCFGVQSIGGSSSLSTAIFNYWAKKEPAAASKAALLYINTGAAAENGKAQIPLGEKQGMNWVYTAGVDVADFNYGPYVQQMKSKGVEFAYFLGAYQQSVRMAQAMKAAGFTPKVAYYSPGVYDGGFIKTGGAAVENATLYVNFTPLEESQRELDLYKQWLAQVAPGAEPSYYGIFAWSAGKLFVEKALGLGGKLTRSTLLDRLRATRGWTGGGMHAPMPVGAKVPPSCIRFLKVSGGKFVPADSGRYTCSGVTTR